MSAAHWALEMHFQGRKRCNLQRKHRQNLESHQLNETNIILAIIGMVGLFATATIYQVANKKAHNYYKK